MRIAFLLTQDLDSPSGVRYRSIARELSLLGHELHLIALHPDFSSLGETRFLQDGIHVWYTAQMHVRKQGNNKTYYSTSELLRLSLYASWRLCKATLQVKPDIIHICKPHPMNSLAGIIAKLLQKKTIYLDCDDIEVASNRFSGRWQKSIIQYFEKVVPRQVNLITTNTHYNKQRLINQGIPAERIIYLPNGVDLTHFTLSDPTELEQLRKDLGLCGKNVIGYIGSISLHSHPVDLLLEAFNQLRFSLPEAVLLLVGGGEDFDAIQKMAREMQLGDRVIFTGRVPFSKIPFYYRLCDVTVDPVYDNDVARGRAPLKLMESWACGVPVVTGDVGDRRLMIGGREAGVLSKPGDPEHLSNSLRNVIIHPDYARTIAQQGLQRVKEYSWEEIVNRSCWIYNLSPSNHDLNPEKSITEIYPENP
jgi:glycosyltransferase involved in cell wall biosynthesis